MLRSACAYTQSDQSLCKPLEYSMTVKLLTEHNLELSLTGGSTGLSESKLVKLPHCLKSHVTAQLFYFFLGLANSVYLDEMRMSAAFHLGFQSLLCISIDLEDFS